MCIIWRAGKPEAMPPNNLITLCDNCHEKFHKGIITAMDLKKRKRRSLRDAAFMGIMRKTLIQRLRAKLTIPVVETRGYITKVTREKLLVLPKSHTNDALAIAHGPQGFHTGYLPGIRKATNIYTIQPVRHHNRQLHKAAILKGGIRKANQAKKYVYGFRLYDKVLYNSIECFVWGRRTSGSFLLRRLGGAKVKDSVSYKHLKLLERSQNYLIA